MPDSLGKEVERLASLIDERFPAPAKNGTKAWSELAWDVVRVLLIPWMVWVTVTLFEMQRRQDIVDATRFTAGDGAALKADMMRELNEHNTDDGHQALRERVDALQRALNNRGN